jgi:hypothetical protein
VVESTQDRLNLCELNRLHQFQVIRPQISLGSQHDALGIFDPRQMAVSDSALMVTSRVLLDSDITTRNAQDCNLDAEAVSR